jgi:hypothetical protein
MRELPTLKDRWFAVALCCACWDRLNPDRKLEPERRAQMEADLAERCADCDKDDIVANRCAACDEQVHAGIYVRVNVQTLRAMRPSP